MKTAIGNTQDVIDSRDIIERIEDLETEIADIEEKTVDAGLNPQDVSGDYDDLVSELAALKALAAECEGYASDWTYGEQLIRRSYFVEYIAELIDDCYDLPAQLKSGEWPYRHVKIDVEAAADEAEQDYTAVDFNGVEYFIRSC